MNNSEFSLSVSVKFVLLYISISGLYEVDSPLGVNITFHPEWMWCTKGQHNFTLFFKALPKNCKVFDLFEDIPELGGFVKKNIRRKKSDVYHVEL